MPPHDPSDASNDEDNGAEGAGSRMREAGAGAGAGAGAEAGPSGSGSGLAVIAPRRRDIIPSILCGINELVNTALPVGESRDEGAHDIYPSIYPSHETESPLPSGRVREAIRDFTIGPGEASDPALSRTPPFLACASPSRSPEEQQGHQRDE